MYLTVIRFDPLKPGFTEFFANPENIHKLIELSLNPDEDGGVPERSLWRSQWSRSEPQLILLSKYRPDPTIFQPYINELSDVKTRSYDDITKFIKSGARFRFILKANPTEWTENHKRVGLKRVNEIRNWLISRGLSLGFTVDEDTFRILSSHPVHFTKKANGHIVSFYEADLAGILTVTDPKAFERALFNGIGHEKAYGCGLLMIQP